MNELQMAMTFSPAQLIVIRDQLVESLFRVRELEKQVQIVPSLQQTILELTEQLADQTRINQDLQKRLVQRTKSVNTVRDNWKYPPSQTVADVKNPTENQVTVITKSLVNSLPKQENPVVFVDSHVQTRSNQMYSQGIQTYVSCDELKGTHVLDELQNFVEQNELMNDALFDADRYADLIYCFQSNRWYDLLILSNVISLGLMPLPEPPSITELDLTIRPPSMDVMIQTDMYDVQFRNWKSVENRCYELICTVDHQKVFKIPAIEYQIPTIRIRNWSNISPPIENSPHLAWSCYNQIEHTEIQIWYCVEWFSVSEKSNIISVHAVMVLFSHAIMLGHNDVHQITAPTLVRRKIKIKGLDSCYQAGFVNHGYRSSESQKHCQLKNRNGHQDAGVSHPFLFNRIFEIDMENFHEEKIQNLDGSFPEPKPVVHSDRHNDSRDLVGNGFQSSVIPLNQSEKIKCQPGPCLLEQTSAALLTSQPIDDVQLVTLKANIVEQSRTEHASLVPRRLLWYFSVSLRQSRSRCPTDDHASTGPRKPTHMPHPRFPFFNALNWRRAREGQKLHEPINNKTLGNEKSDRKRMDSGQNDSNYTTMCDSGETALDVIQTLPDVETCSPVVSNPCLATKETPMEAEKSEPDSISPAYRVPCQTSHLTCRIPLMSPQLLSNCASSGKQNFVFFKGKFVNKDSNPTMCESLQDKRDESKNMPHSVQQSWSFNSQAEPSRPVSCTENANQLQRKCSKRLQFESLNNVSLSRVEAVTGLVSTSFLAACKTFAAWLEDSTNISCKALNDATEIVRRNWFEVTSDPEVNEQRVKAHIKALKGLPSCPIDRVVNMMDENCNTALHYAVSRARWTVVGVLLSHCPGINVNVFNRAGYTPPMLAAVITDQPQSPAELSALEQMLSRADLSLYSANAHKQTVLMLAAIHGRISLVHRLITMHNAPINQKDAEGSTALMAAAEHNRSNVVRLLLSQPDVDATLRDNDGCTALDIALSKRHHDIALMIYAKAKIQRMNRECSHSTILPRFKTTEKSKLPLAAHRQL